MAELTLISSRKRRLKPLVEAARLTTNFDSLKQGFGVRNSGSKNLRSNIDFLRMNSSNALKMINLMKL